MDSPGITLAELLENNIAATKQWQTWFTKNPEALDLPCDIYNSGSIRGLIRHIFAVELRHSQRLLNHPITAYESIPMDTLDTLFATHTQAVKNLQIFLDTASVAEWQEVLAISTLSAGTLQATPRKLFAHILLHSLRHWAQLSTHLRTHGYTTNWPKDLLMSAALL